MNERTLTSLVEGKSWNCQWRPEHYVLYRLSGVSQDGISWQIEAKRHGPIHWETDDIGLLEERDQYIGLTQQKPAPRFSLFQLIEGFFFRRALEKVLNETDQEGDSDDESAPMYYLDFRVPVLAASYYKIFVTGLNEQAARSIFDNETEQAILRWCMGPDQNRFDEKMLSDISVGNSVEVETQISFSDTSSIEQFVELGLVIARKVRRMQAATQ